MNKIMENFEQAFDYILKYEGINFVDNHLDRGGATKFGISEKFIKSIIEDNIYPDKNEYYKNYIKDLTLEDAKRIYCTYFWTNMHEQITDSDICNYIFDMTVNHGAKTSTKLLQQAINAFYHKRQLEIDGFFGKKTLFILNNILSVKNSYIFKSCLIIARESFYRNIIENNPSQKIFLNGWLKRCYGESL